MTLRHVLAAVVVLCARVASGQSTTAITAADLRLHVSALSHDSMRGRATGDPGHAIATRHIVEALQRARVAPRGADGYYQRVPLSVVTPASAGGQISAGTDDLHPRVDFQPLFGMAGVPFPRVAVGNRALEFIYAGRLGDPESLDSSLTKGKIVVFDAPLRTDGRLDYQVWQYAPMLLAHRKAQAILIASLDVTPSSVLDRFANPWIELDRSWSADTAMRPVVAVSRATAGLLRARRLIGSVEFSASSARLPADARNVVAIVPGTDPALASTYVLVSAHTDHLGRTLARTGGDSVFNGANAASGAAALVELAEHFAAEPSRRSLVFLWSAAEEQGYLGERFFLANPTVDARRIFAHVRVDPIGRTTAANMACAPGAPPDVRTVLATLSIRGPAFNADRVAGDRDDALDFDLMADATARVGGVVRALAASDGRATDRATRDDLATACRGGEQPPPQDVPVDMPRGGSFTRFGGMEWHGTP